MAPKAKPSPGDGDDALRRLAEDRLRAEVPATTQGDPLRLLHELQVHQVELEMQNAELRDTRTHLEELVAKYTDLYDFAPVGYFSLDEIGRVQEVNLPGAAMLGVDRSNLLRRRFSSFIARGYQAAFETFLSQVFRASGKQVCELAIDMKANQSIWVDLQATKSVSPVSGRPRCFLAMSDVTALKHAQETQLRVKALEAMNTALKNEILSRKTVEKSLRESRQSQSRMLKESKRMEEELRLLSHQILHTQEEERKRISHDLHDEIAQTLVAINVHLAHLSQGVASDTKDLAQKIVVAQKMVERSVESVHRFAMALRPTQLDDLGLLHALQGCINEFKEQTKVPVLLASPRTMKALDDSRALVLYRVAQAALTNIAQHAGATQVTVDIRQTQRSVCMEINDNGKSFDVKKALHGTKVNRLGLVGMRERVEMVGGAFKIASAPGKGTTIRVTLPSVKTRSTATSTT